MKASFKIIGILGKKKSMVYTVTTLSKLSGATVRALHFYEETDLLKPAYYGSNGYRYYEEKQLLELQQILFFKELGFSLKQIKKVLGKSDFDRLAALHAHKKALNLEGKRIAALIDTIDKTIQHVKGKKTMENKEIFQGFSQVRVGKGDESYFEAESLVLKNLKNSNEKREDIAKVGNEIYSKIAERMKEGRGPFAEEVQDLVRSHHAFTGEFQSSTKDVYKALARLYIEHPEFRMQLDLVHPKLATFISEAMYAFADKELL